MKKITPFSCGTEFMAWQTENCHECKKYNENIKKTCRFEYELGIACLSDGLIKVSTAKKIGRPNEFVCPNRLI